MVVMVFDSHMVLVMLGCFGYGRRNVWCYIFLGCCGNGRMMC